MSKQANPPLKIASNKSWQADLNQRVHECNIVQFNMNKPPFVCKGHKIILDGEPQVIERLFLDHPEPNQPHQLIYVITNAHNA
jgi:hypothetical protein